MGGLFKAPKAQPQQAPVEVPPAPIRTSAEVETLASAQKDRFARSLGRATTQLTGGLGVDGGSTATSVASLLGQVGR